MNLEAVLEIEAKVGGMSHDATIAIPAVQLFELCEVARKALQSPRPEETLKTVRLVRDYLRDAPKAEISRDNLIAFCENLLANGRISNMNSVCEPKEKS